MNTGTTVTSRAAKASRARESGGSSFQKPTRTSPQDPDARRRRARARTGALESAFRCEPCPARRRPQSGSAIIGVSSPLAGGPRTLEACLTLAACSGEDAAPTRAEGRHDTFADDPCDGGRGAAGRDCDSDAAIAQHGGREERAFGLAVGNEHRDAPRACCHANLAINVAGVRAGK